MFSVLPSLSQIWSGLLLLYKKFNTSDYEIMQIWKLQMYWHLPNTIQDRKKAWLECVFEHIGSLKMRITDQLGGKKDGHMQVIDCANKENIQQTKVCYVSVVNFWALLELILGIMLLREFSSLKLLIYGTSLIFQKENSEFIY